jgi:acetolactate synthase-1/2/3 large subunit
VVIALPEDMLRETTLANNPGPWTQVETHPGLSQMAQLQKMLWAAERPLAILGGSRWSAAAVAGVRRFAERFELPVACSFRRQMLFDHEHQSYAGDVGVAINPKLAARVREADVVLLTGGRLSELPSQSYSLMDSPEPQQTLVHVHPGAEELGRVYRPTLAINASPTAFAAALEGIEPPATIRWSAGTRRAHNDYLEWSTPVRHPGGVQVAEIVGWLSHRLPPDAIVTAGAGNYTGWVHRFYRHRRYGTQLAPVSGSMGYGLPASIAAKLRHPDRLVVAFAGDGCFQMTSQEFATAVHYDVPLVLIVIDNSSYGTIRMHQERDFPDRVIGTDLVGPDFVAYAKSFGGYGEKVETTDGFGPAFERALESGKPALLHIVLDREASTASRTLSDIRGTGRH